MEGRISDRCRRICGNLGENCFISNGNQIECISDMVVNKAYSVILCLESAQTVELPLEAAEDINRAKLLAGDLINWVKYLQLTRDLKKLIATSHKTEDERRAETRFPMPEVCRQYIVMEIEQGGFLEPVDLMNFSASGVQFMSSAPLELHSQVHSVLSTRHPISKQVAMKLKVVYSRKQAEQYVIGAQITELSDRKIFDFFSSVYEFIIEACLKGS